ncbi:MAG: FAD-dependent oxidoreductase [Pseudomonadota bacterium]
MSPHEGRRPVTVLGAGIVGICTALSLLERGVPVTLVDRGAPGQETSMGNAGVVSPWSIIPQSLPGTWKSIPKLLFGYGRPLSIDARVLSRMIPWGMRFLRQGQEPKVRAVSEAMAHLCGPSTEIFQKHLAGTGHEDLICDSMYIHAFRDSSRARLSDLEYRIRSEKGADIELVGADALAALEPALSRDFKAAVVIKGQSRARSPGALGRVLAQKAKALGAKFVRAEVKAISPDGTGWRLEAKGETFHAERLVVCLGVWSREMLEKQGYDLPLMAERGYHLEFRAPGITLHNSVMDVDAKVVASSMENGVRVAGQAEFAPVDAPPNARRKDQLAQVAKAAFPDLQQGDATFWMGRRPSFPDSLPMLGASTRHKSLFFNFGHSHYGLMMAPKSGDVLAQTICGQSPNFDLRPYATDRFV